jgi:hypothetical protein
MATPEWQHYRPPNSNSDMPDMSFGGEFRSQ